MSLVDTMGTRPRLAILIACHNRKAKTVEAIRRALGQSEVQVEACVFLFDDGSTDGTGEAVEAAFPGSTILRGDGSYYWTRGMKRAFDEALRVGGFDAYLWLNDDTLLDNGAIRMLVEVAFRTVRCGGEPAIAVGATRDPSTGQMTYGGAKWVDPIWRPFLATPMVPNGQAQAIDVMNGNVVLIPAAIAQRLGSLDPVFEHAMGDTEYSMRARKHGISIFLTPTYVGTCARNSNTGSYRDRSLGFRARMALAVSRKGIPPKSWWHMCRLHGGPLWLIHFVWSYIRIAIGRA